MIDNTDWVNELKAGDKVCIYKYSYKNNECIDIATYIKATPTGQISTDKGRYKKDKFKRFMGVGNAKGYIAPYTKELEEECIEKKNKMKIDAEIKGIKEKAIRICYDIAHDYKELSYEQAKAIIKIMEDQEQKNV